MFAPLLLALLVPWAVLAQDTPDSYEARLRADIQAIARLSALGPEARDLLLEDALRLAMAENLGMRVRVRELEAARYRLAGAWSPWMPYLMASWSTQPRKSETFFQQYESWERVQSLQANYSFGAGFNLFTGTSFSATWSQGLYDQTTAYDPEIVLDNPLDPDTPIEILVGREFSTRWASLGFNLNQNLLRGIDPEYHLRTVRTAELAVDAAQLQQDQQMAQVAADVLGAYWDLWAARQNVEIALIDRRLADEQRTSTEALIGAGQAAPIELLRIDETVATRSAAVLEAERAAAEAEQRLVVLMGGDPVDALDDPPLRPINGAGLELPARDLVASSDVARSRNPQLRLVRQDLERRQLEWRSRKHEVLPTLDLAATLNLTGRGFDAQEAVSDVFSRQFPDFTVGMDFRMPLPDVGAWNAIRAAQQDVEAAQATWTEAERDVLAGLASAQRSIASFAEQVEVARARTALAERSAEAAEATFVAGRNTLREVLEAQSALKAARQSEVSARVEVLKAQVELEVLRGTLLETLGVELQ